MPRRSRPRSVSFRMSLRRLGVTAAAVAGMVSLASAGVAHADPGRGTPDFPQPRIGAPDGVHRGAFATPRAARRSVVSSARCRTAVTVVRPGGAMSLGVVEGDTGRLYPTGASLAYDPVAIAFVKTSTNRGITTDQFLATDEAGRLHEVVVTARGGAEGEETVSVADTVAGRGWQGIRYFVAGGPYLYALTETGGLKRYAVSSTLEVTSAGTIATRGWGDVTSLAYGGWWKLPKGEVADDLVGATGSGRLSAYVVPRDDPDGITSRLLEARGWGAFSHVAVGSCPGKARSLVGIKPDGSVHAFVDADGNDQSGDDIRSEGRVATGWTGRIAD